MTGQSPRGGSGRCPRSGSLPAQTHSSSWEWECARVQTRLLLWHLCTCSCMWLPHLENFPFFVCPDVLMLCTLGCVGTQARSLPGHVHPHSCWHTCLHVHTRVTQCLPSPPHLLLQSPPLPRLIRGKSPLSHAGEVVLWAHGSPSGLSAPGWGGICQLECCGPVVVHGDNFCLAPGFLGC